MSKWDTIQADVQDQYAHLEEEEMYEKLMSEEEDVFGFTKAISIDHLTDEQLDEVFNMFGDK
jgi:hypothetical protein